MRPLTRRVFMKTSAAATLWAKGSVLGANNTIRLALIGCSGQGVGNLRDCLKMPDTKAVALCDVDQTQLAKAKQRFSDADTTADFRRILDRQDVDAVIIATPDHWHAIPALQTLQAGKDLYLEKPIGHTIREGQLLVKSEAVQRLRAIQRASGHSAAEKAGSAVDRGLASSRPD